MAIYLVPDKTKTWNGLKINEYFLHNHNVNKIDLPTAKITGLMGVTIHNTDWITVNSATTPAEQYTRATVNGNMNTVRVHFYVDNTCAWQNLDTSYTSWHAADGNGNGNMKTISIECLMDGTSNSYNSKSKDNAARLAAYLLYANGFTANNLYTHTHWLNVRDGKTGTTDYLNTLKHPYKTCPFYIIPQWDEFKKLVDSYIVKLGGKSVYSTTSTSGTTNSTTTNTNTTAFIPYLVKVIDTSLNVRKDAGLNNPVVCVIKKNEVYTIIEEKTVKNSDGSTATWGLLKAYQTGRNGWINVGDKYVTKVK